MDSMWLISGQSPAGFEWKGGEAVNLTTGGLKKHLLHQKGCVG